MRSRQQLVVALAATAVASPAFDWEAITPSRHLNYHDCYSDFRCARLEVPLDWLNESDSRTAAIAIIKLPAVVPDDDPAFGGSIFTNPGGPGGSGVNFAIQKAQYIQQVLVDKPGHRHYEIVSFDPRGISHTTPRSDCFNHDVLARNALTFELRGNGGLDSGLAAINYELAMTESLSRRCKEAEAMRYVNTPSVARDMVEIVDRIDELRRREAANKKRGEEPRPGLRQRTDQNNHQDVPRLQYMGYSYGTVLGNYFASLFPGRVGRIVLDGVSNADDYANGAGWLTNLVDTDAVFDEFWNGCFEAGPSVCALAGTYRSASEAQERYSCWVQGLDKNPLPVSSPTGSIMVLTGRDVRQVISSALYEPLDGFKLMAEALNEAMAGDTTGLVHYIVDGGVVPSIHDSCPTGNGTVPDVVGSEAGSAVLCSDGDDVTGHDASWWQTYVDHQLGLSKLLGSYWSTIRFACSSWPFRPNWTFKGPFSTPEADPSLIPGRPAAPLLFLSTRLDPATPLGSARAMARRHPGSAVVVQDSVGHCTFGTSPCTRRIIADYFEHGTVPEGETACETSCGPWDDGCDAYKAAGFEAGESSFYKPLRRKTLRRRFPLGL